MPAVEITLNAGESIYTQSGGMTWRTAGFSMETNSKIKDAVPGLRFTTDIHQGIHQILEHYKKSNDYLYDYQYEGQLDRMMNKFGIKTSFIMYQGSLKVSRYLYLLYRYFPYKIASRLNRIFKL